jgi:predicted O-methyltransferase YrrM
MINQIKNRIHEFNAARELTHVTPILQKQKSSCKDISEIINLVYGEFNRFFWIKQVRSEIMSLAELISSVRPKSFLEIGTASGGSLFILSQCLSRDAKIISIDLPEGEFGGGYPQYKNKFYRSFASFNQTITLVRADSHLQSTVSQAETLLNNEKLEFLFIDGDHTYEGVKHDFETYKHLVKKNGIIAFHDVAKHSPNSKCKVHLFWDEIKEKYEYKEFIEKPDQGWAGIGVIFYKESL